MPLFEAYTVDQLNRALAITKWMLALCGLVFACVAIVNQWLYYRVTALQRQEKARAEQRLKTSEAELQHTKAETAEIASQLERFTGPRHLTDEQIIALRQSLPKGPRGKVVMTYISIEPDAQKYAEEIGKLLSETGFQVSTSRSRWLKLATEGIYLCARDTSYAPPHAVHIQLCFQSAGLRLRAHQNEKMFNDMSVPDDAVIFVVGNRERGR
ncbi:MAG TPA: hypothetical protein VJ063_00385 [Verrucomicrobiae bacterium]|nr:hypothetical protein [Verrucomicrobiae bacterium]